MPDDLELLHAPPANFKIRCATHLVHRQKVPPGGVTAAACEIAFPGCDHEPAQADCRVGL
jgi:hypothetical protein